VQKQNLTNRNIPTAFVSTRILEIGAGNASVGRYSGQFTTQLTTSRQAREVILLYANKVLVRPWRGKFNDVLAVSSDRTRHRHVDLVLDATDIQLPNQSFHFVVSVGARRYGFRNEFTAFELLKEVHRVLTADGEFHVFGNYENAWFNMDMGSTNGRRVFRRVARRTGFRVHKYLQPIKYHPWYTILKNSHSRIVTINCQGSELKPPSHFHLLASRDS